MLTELVIKPREGCMKFNSRITRSEGHEIPMSWKQYKSVCVRVCVCLCILLKMSRLFHFVILK